MSLILLEPSTQHPAAFYKATRRLRVGDYKTLHRIADSLEPDLRRVWLKAIAQIKSAVVLARLQQALEEGNVAEAETLIPFQALDTAVPLAAKVMRDALEEAAEATARMMQPEINLAFDVTNPRAVQAAARQAGTMITETSLQTKLAVRQIITRAVDEGIAPYKAARMIREHIGLTKALSKAVANYERGQLAAGVTQAKAAERAARYAKRLLNYRAKNISRTEILRAANQGQQELWRQARDNGLLRGTVKRIWIVTPDDRLCDICAPLDGKVVGLEENFTGYRRNASGNVSEIYSELTPPLHPQCRCAIALSFEN